MFGYEFLGPIKSLLQGKHSRKRYLQNINWTLNAIKLRLLDCSLWSLNSCSVHCNFLRIAHLWKKMLFHFSSGTGSSAAKIDCSQSPIFHNIVRIESWRGLGGHLGFICTEGAGYNTHPRWPLLTQSAYGKTRDSEQCDRQNVSRIHTSELALRLVRIT